MRKRLVIVGWIALLLGTVVAAEDRWDFPSYEKLLAESGRRIGSMNEEQFLALQGRKEKVLQVIGKMLKDSFGSADTAVLEAFARVPREYFMYNYETERNMAASTYEIPFKEWPIGYGSVLSDYIVQSYMTALVEPKPTDVSLEVGTGSGYQSAILSRLVREAYTIEIITRLGEKVDRIYAPLGYGNIRTRTGDGFYGWPEVLFTKDAQGKVHSRKDAGVIFIPMRGEIEKQAPLQPAQ
jgi:protein-L-isoaspartate(D-aspartate) O-methyltransferase